MTSLRVPRRHHAETQPGGDAAKLCSGGEAPSEHTEGFDPPEYCSLVLQRFGLEPARRFAR